MKKLIRLTESDLHDIIMESVKRIINEGSDVSGLIRDVLFSGHCYNTNNKNGYDIGIGYGCGTDKDFFHPGSSSMEYSYCHVSVDDINRVVRELEGRGYEFKNDGGFVSMCGERDGFKPFVPKKSRGYNEGGSINPRTDPVGYNGERLFNRSKDGNLNLF